MQWATAFAAILYVVQQLEGTDAYFSICVFFFIIIATFAFNYAGGMTSATGGYVFFYSMLVCVVGWTTKAVLGEPADSHLMHPTLDVSIYLGSIVSLAVAVVCSRKFLPTQSLIQNWMTEKDAPAAAFGCAALGIFFVVLTNTIPHGDGSLLSALAQFSDLLPLAIILAVRHEITETQGKKSINLVAIAAAFVLFVVNGLINFGKEGIFTPVVCYLVAASSMRFRVSIRQLVLGVAAIYLMSVYLVPYSQYGRQFKSKDEDASVARFVQNATVSTELLSELGYVRQQYEATQFMSAGDDSIVEYFNSDHGLLSRLHMITPDDALNDATENGRNLYGFFPLLSDLLDLVPHALWPEKPDVQWGNMYAHEIGGILDDNDFTTGISFSPSSQAYHMAGWYGVFLLAPAIWFIVFLAVDSIVGDTRSSPWALVFLVYYAHAAPELMLDGAIGALTRYAPMLIVTAWFFAYVMPLFAGAIARPRALLRPVATNARGRL